MGRVDNGRALTHDCLAPKPEDLGGPPIKAFGFALGVERLILSLPESVEEKIRKRPDYFLIYRGEEAFGKVLELSGKLRRKGFAAEYDFRGGSLKSQLKMANRRKARFSVIIGEDEMEKKAVQLRDMDKGEQTEIAMDRLGEN